jgi:hypothetical protein
MNRCPYKITARCPPLPADLRKPGSRGPRRCPFKDCVFLHHLGMWCKIPLLSTEDELIWRCDISAGVTDVGAIDVHYRTGEVNRRICREFCRAHDEYQRRIVDYRYPSDVGLDDSPAFRDVDNVWRQMRP